MSEKHVIDLVREFETHESSIGKYWKARISGYFGSNCYKALDKKIKTMEDCSDLIPAVSRYNEWQSGVSFPIVKERMLLRRAIISANYRAPEIFSLSPIGGTPYENSARAQMVINLNMTHTRFRELTLKPGINTASKFGFFVVYSYWKSHEGDELRTIYNPDTGLYDRKRVPVGYENAYNCQIKPRDYFQNPEVANPEDSDFQGHIRRVHISELVVLLNDPVYIRENVQKVLEQARNGQIKGIASERGGDNYSEYDERRYCVDIYRIEGKINIKGNEEDGENYVTEMVGDTIIRLSREDYDRGIRSYTVVCIDKSSKYWFGVTDAEYVVTHENYLNTLMGMNLDNAMRSIQNYIFYDKKSISQNDLQNIYRNGGLVAVDANNIPITQLVSSFQPGRIDLTPTHLALNQVQQSIQQIGTKVDLSRKSEDGGLSNKTATAANIIAGQGDMLESDLLENFDFGVCRIGYIDIVMLQQFLPDLFYVRAKPREVEQRLNKYEILGDFDVDIQSTLQKNRSGELLRLQNVLTWWLNVSSNPQLQQSNINILPLLKEIWNKADVPSDEIMPDEQVQLGAPGMIPSNKIPAMQGGGMVPVNMQTQMQSSIPGGGL
ncbi:MAG: hypothetical protein JXB48_21230 [Candidatus Latescibacteria bacterium]|nr:hypothetical protein [Candidatus Latescibacterota bacterium]